MIGAIAGDIIGSRFEHSPIKTKDFSLFHSDCRFTDDTVLTIAIAQAILGEQNYLKSVWDLGGQYPNAGYGSSFIHWLQSDPPTPYNSWGNGSAMRVSAIGFAFDTEEKVLEESKRSAIISHNHPEGIKGAQATALAIFLARTTGDKSIIQSEIEKKFGYNLNRTIKSIRPSYDFDVSCQGSVPESIISFLESDCYEDAIRNAVSLGGDSDTMACIAGGIAEAFYGPIDDHIQNKVQLFLNDELWNILSRFNDRFC